ncbi:DUF305 domain-containing protein [Euzebyella marina]|uniref:DUF305 domain-containing protein n=2 Tax=Euzebyella marina TaxID=1761453 RepID=A0A3G2LBP5_9FLAO|nr:DUF305 domain-containing protein [Euzebyella marina]MAU70524.1 DUF305 domain-containing protein [Pseudozobellia sp.]MBC7000826.1 DUF305 domain-containing protein [Cytophaga sp. FL35]MBG48012.1 DUF305 domain-containing protein [Pseudozobellia sp.]
MYVTMYFNTYELSHVFFSWTRMYMTIIGVSGMSLIMYFFMRDMYPSRRKNSLIVGLSLLIMGLATYLVRYQKPINDVKWMKAMIPHHSIAILTSERANITDPEVKRLADDIIEAQRKEIAEMKSMIERLEKREH